MDFASARANFSCGDNFYVIEAVISSVCHKILHILYAIKLAECSPSDRIGAVWLILCNIRERASKETTCCAQHAVVSSVLRCDIDKHQLLQATIHILSIENWFFFLISLLCFRVSYSFFFVVRSKCVGSDAANDLLCVRLRCRKTHRDCISLRINQLAGSTVFESAQEWRKESKGRPRRVHRHQALLTLTRCCRQLRWVTLINYTYTVTISIRLRNDNTHLKVGDVSLLILRSLTVDIAEFVFFATVPEIWPCGIHLFAHVSICPCAIFINGEIFARRVRSKAIVFLYTHYSLLISPALFGGICCPEFDSWFVPLNYVEHPSPHYKGLRCSVAYAADDQRIE